MKVAFVTSEAAPFAKTGGLADVAGALPPELAKMGTDVKVFMPKYYSVDESRFDLKEHRIGEFQVRTAGKPRDVKLFTGKMPNSEVEVIFIDCPYYFHRHQLYTEHPDEDERFILFTKAVIETIQRIYWTPDVIHCNDWQSALLPLLLKDNYSWDRLFDNVATVLTIHNIGYQGKFGPETIFKSEIRTGLFYPGGPVELAGDVNFLKTGIEYADMVNTVSPNYAEELLTPEYGADMDPYLKTRGDDFYGILNGVDYATWNPEKDRYLKTNYSVEDLSGKAKNRKELLKFFEMKDSRKTPVIGMISRMAIQKGFDIFSDILGDLEKLNVKWAILGSGEKKYEKMFKEMAEKHPEKFGVYIGFNNELAHLIEAGSDIFLMPSHYEPCGLNQIYSLKYGTVPLVRKTGGLADTVTDFDEDHENATGFVFEKYTGEALLAKVKRALEVYGDRKKWEHIVKNGMKKDFSWKKSAREYIGLYNKAIKKRRGA